MKYRPRPCQECGKSFTPKTPTRLFCDTPCRNAFNARRRDRGAELYDVLMVQKFEPNKWDANQIPPVDKLLLAYKAADDARRGGRRSWQNAWDVSTKLPMAYSTEGDKR